MRVSLSFLKMTWIYFSQLAGNGNPHSQQAKLIINLGQSQS